MSADTSWRGFERGGAGPKPRGRTRGIFMATAAAPIFIWYEKSRLRRARVKPEKYTPVISLYLRSIRTPPPASHRRSIRLFLFGKPDILSVARFRSCMRFLFARRKTTVLLLREKEGSFYLHVEDLPRSL